MSFLLLGCGSQPQLGFVNQTRHSDASLWTIWYAAQQSIAQKIDLNPVQQSLENAVPQILPGDQRALSVLPYELTVAHEADVSSAALFAATGVRRSDPTGLISCPQPCNVRYATAYSIYQPEQIRYAASWESSGSNFSTILQYEFENQILFSLRYDLRWR
jgi:hypothetical protein